MSYALLSRPSLGEPSPPKQSPWDWLIIAGLFGTAYWLWKTGQGSQSERD